MKKCFKCKIEKDLSEYGKDKYTKDGLTYRCKNCRNSQYNDYYKKNPEKQKQKNNLQKENRKKYYSSEDGVRSSRKSHLKRTYGITIEEYEFKLNNQDNKCAICNNYNTHDKHGVLAVDHCHKTGLIRDLLCFKCNAALGAVNEDIDILKKMIKYLKKHNNS